MKPLVSVFAAAALATACAAPSPTPSTAKSDPTTTNTSHQLPTPRPLAPSIKADATAALEKYLTSLIEEYEGMPANVPNVPEEKDLEVTFNAGEKPCRLSADGAKLACQVDYLQDRWNGTMNVELKVEGGNAVTLTSAEFSGNF